MRGKVGDLFLPRERLLAGGRAGRGIMGFVSELLWSPGRLGIAQLREPRVAGRRPEDRHLGAGEEVR